MGSVQTLPVAEVDDGIRLDRWFKRHFPDVAFGQLQKWCRKGQVRVDGGRVKSSQRLAAGQTVRVPPLGESKPRPAATARPVADKDAEELRGRILHQDAKVLVLDKPPGLAVQGGSGQSRHLDGMLDALRFGSEHRPRLVHRLDKDTSGVLLLARDPASAAWLTGAFRSKAARKLYWAAVVGIPKPPEGTVKLALSKLPGKHGERMVPDVEGGKRAVTLYQVIERVARKAAWLALEPRTGRTHQLRVHCAEALGTPILGDGKYGGAEASLQGDGLSRKLHLHARAIRVPHPDGGVVEAEAALPDHMARTWKFLGFDPDGETEFFPDDLL